MLATGGSSMLRVEDQINNSDLFQENYTGSGSLKDIINSNLQKPNSLLEMKKRMKETLDKAAQKEVVKPVEKV